MMKRFHSVPTPALLCNKEPAQGTQSSISCLSLCLHDLRIGGFCWLVCFSLDFIDKVDEVDLSQQSSHTTHPPTTTHINCTSLFLTFPAPSLLPCNYADFRHLKNHYDGLTNHLTFESLHGKTEGSTTTWGISRNERLVEWSLDLNNTLSTVWELIKLYLRF